MSDAKPILSPAQVELCMQEIDWAYQPSALVGMDAQWGTPEGEFIPATHVQRDGRFLFALETVLMEREWVPVTLPTRSHLHRWGMLKKLGASDGGYHAEPAVTYRDKVEADTHEAAVLEAALVGICGEANE